MPQTINMHMPQAHNSSNSISIANYENRKFTVSTYITLMNPCLPLSLAAISENQLE